eukprot:c53807_g1_i1 orf=67-300(-)
MQVHQELMKGKDEEDTKRERERHAQIQKLVYGHWHTSFSHTLDKSGRVPPKKWRSSLACVGMGLEFYTPTKRCCSKI